MSKIWTEILKQGIRSTKVLSCSFFTTEDSYRDFWKYQSSLTNFLEQQKQISGFEVRIYTDDSGKDFALEASTSHDNVSVYHYNCPSLRHNKWHVGMFGSLCRLLPLFEELEVVWVSDIDIPTRFLNPHILNHLNNDTPIYIDTRVCNINRKFGQQYPIILHKFISRMPLPYSLFEDFLSDLLNDQAQHVIGYLNTNNKTKPRSKIPYGIDEYFMNTRVYEYLKTKKITCLVGKDFLNRAILRETLCCEFKSILKYYFETHDSAMLEKVKEILKKELPALTEKYPCSRETLDNLERLNVSSVMFYKTLL